jgi:glycerophosphoryl diester phosphodiesterase
VVAQLPWREVREARIGGREPIPTLEDLLGSWPEVRVNIDVKEAGAVAPLVDVIRRTGAVDRVCVASFSGRRVAAVRRRVGARLCTAMAPPAVGLLRLAATLPLASRLVSSRAACAQVPAGLGPIPVVTPPLLALAHRRDLRVHVWTVDDAAEMTRLLDMGVDGLMTDQLRTLRDVLTQRGEWVT